MAFPQILSAVLVIQGTQRVGQGTLKDRQHVRGTGHTTSTLASEVRGGLVSLNSHPGKWDISVELIYRTSSATH